MLFRRPNTHSTTMAAMEPSPFLHSDQGMQSKLDREKVWATPAVVSKESITPRSYLVITPQGVVLRRNHHHLRLRPSPQPTPKTPSTTHRGYGGAAIPVGFCPNTYTCPYRRTGSGTHQVQPGMQASHETGSVDTGVSTIWTGVMGGLEGLGCCQNVFLLFFHFMV